LKIEITSGDIRDSWSGSQLNPVALALNRQCGWRWSVTDDMAVRYSENEHRREYPLPNQVRKFLQRYYDEKVVVPFAFELEV